MMPRITEHTYIGREGKLVEPRSEGEALLQVAIWLEELQRDLPAKFRDRLEAPIDSVLALHKQVALGYHRNPAVTIFANPPAWKIRQLGVLSHDVHDIRYTHEQDGAPYEHAFETPHDLLVVERIVRGRPRTDVLITSATGLPVVEDF